MNKNTNTHDRIAAAILAQTREVWEDDAPHAADDGYIGDMLDAISPCPRYDMLDEDWEAIETMGMGIWPTCWPPPSARTRTRSCSRP